MSPKANDFPLLSPEAKNALILFWKQSTHPQNPVGLCTHQFVQLYLLSVSASAEINFYYRGCVTFQFIAYGVLEALLVYTTTNSISEHYLDDERPKLN